MGHEVVILVVRVNDIGVDDTASFAVAGLIHGIRTVREHAAGLTLATSLEIDSDNCSPDLVSLRTDDVCNGSVDADRSTSSCDNN